MKPITALDILNGATLAPLSSGAETVKPAVFAPSPLLTPVVMERFRTATSNMHKTARDSIKQEIMRIIALPIVSDPTQEEIDLVSWMYCPAGTMKLYKEQVKAMMEYHDDNSVGIVAPIAVGGGKTLITVLIANDAYKDFGKRRIVLMVPTQLVDQLRDTELPFYRRHISINVPFYWLAGQSAGKRMLLANSGKAGCYVVSYSLLSGSKGAEILEAIKPDLIIGDEIHSIASANVSARGRRFKYAVKKFAPQLVGLSGTITKKSPRDYHHFVTNALQENSFIPRPTSISEEWAKIIDCNASSIDEFHTNSAPQPGPIKPLIEWAKKNWPGEEWPMNLIGFRKAYNRRMETCPGVVASGGEELGVSLSIKNIDKKEMPYSTSVVNEECQGWEQLKAIVKQLVGMWVAPNGDEIDHAMHLWKWRYELEGFGFYNNLFWPDVEKLADKKRMTISAATDILDRSKHHHEVKQDYHKELRQWSKHHAKKGMDTPFLIGGDMSRNQSANVGQSLYNAWKATKDSMFEGMIEREKEIVRVCDFRLKRIVEWAKWWHKERPNKAAIVWFKNKGVAEWLREAFMEADLPTLFCPAGPHGKKNLEDRTKGDMFAIASISSYHKGLNLQYHHDAEMFAQWCREAHIAQQAMGRVHRNEQKSDEVNIFRSCFSEFDKVLFASCINDAAYIHQTSQKQKLMYADYDERPQVLPYAVLMEWGTQVQQLDVNSIQMLSDKFAGKGK